MYPWTHISRSVLPEVQGRYAGPMTRDDYTMLGTLGLSDDDLRDLDLWELATATPDGLVEAYLRRSNRKEDTATLRGHLRDIVRWARAEGMQIRHVHFEQLSASKSYVRRTEFENATRAILDGRSKTMAVWKTDRFDRRGMGAVGTMLDQFSIRRARLVSVVEGLDSSKGGRMVFAILAERAREEAADIALRVKMGHDSHEEENRRGTGVPPYGLFSKRGSGKIEPHREEFAVARRIAELLLDDVSATGVANTLNAEGITTRSGASWTGAAISRVAQSPLWGGMVPQRERVTDEFDNPTGVWRGYGEPSLDAEGKPRICGTGVVTQQEWYAIRAKIDARTGDELGKGRRRGKTAAKYQGTGVYRCGRVHANGKPCLSPLSHRGGKYQCIVRGTRGPAVCQGVSTLADRADFAIGEAWINHVGALEPGDPVLMVIGRRWLAFSDPETQAAREHARVAMEGALKRVQRLEDDYYLHGKISEERYEELSAAQRATIEVMSTALSALDRSADLSPMIGGDMLRESWGDADVSTRRMLLLSTLGPRGVMILPAAHQGDRSPIQSRLRFDWVSHA